MLSLGRAARSKAFIPEDILRLIASVSYRAIESRHAVNVFAWHRLYRRRFGM